MANTYTTTTTYTTGTPLNFKQAMQEAVELFNIQSQRDHELIEAAHDAATLQAANDHASIQTLIDTANDSISITDVEILEMFPADVQKKYKKKHSDKYNFETEPEVLLDILQADETFGASFVDYSASIENKTISLTKDGADTFTFTIDTSNNLLATGTISEDNYEANYTTETLTKIDN